MLQWPNRTGQAATYHSGTPNYVDVGSGAAEAGLVTVPSRATSDSWADGDTVSVLIKESDSAWWCGIGTWDETNEHIELTTEEDSAGTLTDTGAVTVLCVPTRGGLEARIEGGRREMLTADRTYYVATTGSDSNDGLTAGSPFLTIQKAVDVVCSIDCSIYQATIQIADGTYSAGATLNRYNGAEAPVILGNASVPANCVVSVNGGTCFYNASGQLWNISGVKLVTTTSGNCIHVNFSSSLVFSAVDFGACAGYHIIAESGSTVSCLGTSYAITGGANTHLRAGMHSIIWMLPSACVISGTPAFAQYFANVDRQSTVVIFTEAYSGSATGARYYVHKGGIIDAGGGTLPGNSAGTQVTATYGLYI